MGRSDRRVGGLWLGLCCLACGRTELSGWTLESGVSNVGGAAVTSSTGLPTSVGGSGGGGASGGDGNTASLVSTSAGGSGGERAVEVTLTASDDRSEAVVLGWSVTGLAPAHFVLERDGSELVELAAGNVSYADRSAREGIWDAPTNLVASEGTRADAVDLSWQPADAEQYAHRYRLFAVAADGTQQPSNVAEGWRTAPELVSYEISRDDGQTWQSVGIVTSTSDADAPLGSLTAPTEALPRDERDYVRLSVTAEPSFAPAIASYRVRALSEVGPSRASDAAQGYRAMGNGISYQWQRSNADADADYGNLTEVTGAIWFSPAQIGAGYFYRAALSAEGAAGFSEPVRAELVGFTTLSAGAFHTCGLTPSRVGRCWGGNATEGAPPDTPLKSLSAGPSGGCGIRDDGKRVCWGRSVWGDAVFPHEPSEQTFVAVSAGLEISCGILEGGELSCWGLGGKPPPPLGTFKSLSVGGTHACAIDSDDRVQCWGENEYGQAPPGPSEDRFKQVSAGWNDHTCGVRLDDTIACWGKNDYGQAPGGPSPDAFSSVAAGVFASCGLRQDRKLFCWGDETSGDAPIGLSSEEYVAITMGYYHTCALRPDGGVRCWGSEQYGQVPYVPRRETFESVSVGDYYSEHDHPHACGITTEGKLVCWGNNEEGQAPPGPSERSYAKVAAGSGHTCALGSDGELWCWGYDYGDRMPPEASHGSYTDLSVDSFSTCAVGADSTVTCFGAAAGETLWGTRATSARSVSVGRHACALGPDGELSCWGWQDDSLGLAPPSSKGPFEAVSVAIYHTCALGTDRRLACWGDLYPFDDIEPNWPSDPLLSMDAGDETLCGIRAEDQRLICHHRAGDWFETPSLDRFLSVSTANRHFCAVRSDGKLLCLGEQAGL